MPSCKAEVFAPDNQGLPLAEKSFARHETFHLRYGWLKKGFDEAARDDEVFTRPDAAVRLGVGKNMVRAIRYWCRAFKVTAEEPSSDNARLLCSLPTPLGGCLLGDDGWDPYLENPASLWLLHWLLLRPTCAAPVWHLILNRPSSGVFTESDLLREVATACAAHPGWNDVAESSLKKDVDCFLRMYSPRRTQGKTLEDSLDSPFAGLGLVSPVGSDRHTFTLNVGPKEGLADEVVVFALADFHRRRNRTDVRTALLSRFAHEDGSPGRVFRLSEADLRDSVFRVQKAVGCIELTEVAGRAQLVFPDDVSGLESQLLDGMYEGGLTHARQA